MKLTFKHVLAAIVLVLSFAAPGITGPYEDALDAFVDRDYASALKLFRRAADQGNANGFFMLGVMYATGQGTPQNYFEAAKWYGLAADQGSAAAQYSLGDMYATGQGVQLNYVSAYMWLSLAAAQGEQTAIRDRDLVARRMTPEQIAEAQKLAREWKPSTHPPR
jgi:uncharacterized protein